METVSIVFLVYNRRDELRTSLREMLSGDAYERDALDVIVVDNASEDGAADMVRAEFPDVRVVQREENCGVSAWNDGFAIARGDWVLALDDDCYLPGDGLKRAIAAAQEHEAHLVSFSVRSSVDPTYRFDQRYRSGLLTFWGCAVLMRREVIDSLRGFDPGVFIWAHELEFMLRFFDRGFRHLHLPEVTAIHMKLPPPWREYLGTRAHRFNYRHFGYIAAKRLRARDAVEALIALAASIVRDGVRTKREALKALPDTLAGFAAGLRQREPVRNPRVSRTFRRNLESYASPWWVSRTMPELARALPGELARVATGRSTNGTPPPGRRDQYYAERARYFPTTADTLEF